MKLLLVLCTLLHDGVTAFVPTRLPAVQSSYLQGLSSDQTRHWSNRASTKEPNASTNYLKSLSRAHAEKKANIDPLNLQPANGVGVQKTAKTIQKDSTLMNNALVEGNVNASHQTTPVNNQSVAATKSPNYETIGKVTQTNKEDVKTEPLVARISSAVKKTDPLNAETAKEKKDSSPDYLASLEKSSINSKSATQMTTGLEFTTVKMYKDETVCDHTTATQTKLTTQDYLSSLARFDAEIQAETRKATVYLDSTIAALYSAAKVSGENDISNPNAASYVVAKKELTKDNVVSETARNDVVASVASTTTTEHREAPMLSISADTAERISKGSDFCAATSFAQEDDISVEANDEATAIDGFPQIYTSITEDMVRRVTMAAEFIMEKPGQVLDYIDNELTVGELTDLVTRGLTSLGEMFVMAFGVVVKAVSGHDLNEVVSSAQTAAANVITTSVASMQTRAQEVGDMEVSQVLQSAMELMVSILSSLFRMFNAIVDIVSSKSAKEIGDMTVDSIEQQANEVMATVKEISDKNRQELATKLEEFESKAANAVVTMTSGTIKSLGGDLSVLTELKVKARELSRTRVSKTKRNENAATEGV